MICKNYEDMLNKTKKFLNYKKIQIKIFKL